VKLDAQQTQVLANAEKNPQHATLVLAPVLKAQFPGATDEQLAEILNKLHNGK